jgi:hypothetical protein
VGGYKDQGVFHADPYQIGDGKKPPVVDFVIGGKPVRKYIRLIGKQPVEQHKAGGLPSTAIKNANILIDEGPHFGRALIQLPEPFLKGFPLHASLPRHLDGESDALGKIGRGGENSSHFPKCRVVGAQFVLQLAKPMLQDKKVGFGRDGQLGIVTLDEKSTLVETQLEILVLERLGVGVAKDRQENLVLQHHAGRMPVDIKE